MVFQVTVPLISIHQIYNYFLCVYTFIFLNLTFKYFLKKKMLELFMQIFLIFIFILDSNFDEDFVRKFQHQNR
jgi:hypothetical protein